MKIEKINIDEIMPYENNAKIHTKWQIDQIKKSIQEFGNNDPIAIDKNNMIIEGHGRYLALKELGYEEIDVIRLDHLNEEQRKAYTLVHNKLTMNTGFDVELLEIELEEIQNYDMSDYGLEIIENDESYIDELLENDFVSLEGNRSDFSFTLNMPIEYKLSYENYIRENGKQLINDLIINEISKEED